jgi:glycosyltransferase involved in cell wall biosynthesis
MGGWLDRGIPLYTRNLIETLRLGGFEVIELRAFAFQRQLPRLVNHILGTLVEQFISPFYWRIRGAIFAIYPYNSIAILDVLNRNTLVVIHDAAAFEFKLHSKMATRWYYRVVYGCLHLAGKPIYTVSEIEVERLSAFGFGYAPIGILPNSFDAFLELLAEVRQDVRKENVFGPFDVMLCTGFDPQKDHLTALLGLLPRLLDRGWKVAVFGLQTTQESISEICPHPAFAGQVKILPRLSDSEVARFYLASRIIWVHSLREGFGRCVVEGRLAGKPVVGSRIPEFERLLDPSVYLYEDPQSFDAAFDRANADSEPGPYIRYEYRSRILNALPDSTAFC